MDFCVPPRIWYVDGYCTAISRKDVAESDNHHAVNKVFPFVAMLLDRVVECTKDSLSPDIHTSYPEIMNNLLL